MYEVRIEAHFEDRLLARAALADMEEVVGKNSGEVMENVIEDLDEEYDDGA